MKFLQIFLVAVFFTGTAVKATQHDPAWSVKFTLENGTEITRLEGGGAKIKDGSISYFDREFYFTKNEPEAYQEEVGRLGSISKTEKLK